METGQRKDEKNIRGTIHQGHTKEKVQCLNHNSGLLSQDGDGCHYTDDIILAGLQGD